MKKLGRAIVVGHTGCALKGFEMAGVASFRGLIGGDGKPVRSNSSQTVRGQLHVSGADLPNPEYSSTRGWWAGVLTAPGLTPTVVVHRETSLIEKWPESGQVVPVKVTLSSPVVIAILWDEVPTREDKALQRAKVLLEGFKLD